MTRRVLPKAAVLVLPVVVASCGLGSKESLADRVTRAADRLEASGTASGMLEVSVTVLKSDDHPIVPGPPKILPGRVTELPVVLDLEHDAAAVGARGSDPKTAVIVFSGGELYQRIAPKTTSVASAVLASAASNLQPLVDAYRGTSLNLTGAAATTSSTTTTTIVHTALRRASRIPREWIAFDYDQLEKKDDTKRAGSFAISPIALLRLVHGILTGSIEQHGNRFDANVNRDKAERNLSDDDRKLLDKVFRANAVSGRTFPAHIWLDANGALRKFEVRMRQHLTSIDRADLTVTIDLDRTGMPLHIGAPDRKATASVSTLGQLVTSVART